MSETVDIGGIKARIDLEVAGYLAGTEKAKAATADLGAAGKKAATDLQAIGDSGDKIAQLTKTLDNINAKIEIQRRKLAELKASLETTFNQAKKTKLQEQIVNAEANLLRLIQTSDSTAAKIVALEDAADSAGNQFAELSSRLKEIGLSADQISKIDKSLNGVNAKPTEAQLRAMREELVRVGASAQQIEKIERELKDTEKQADKTKQGISGLSAGLTALGAGAAATKIANVIGTFAEEANQLQMAYSGVAAVSKSMNIDVAQTTGLIEELSARWGMNEAALAETVKTYLTAGLTLDETRNIIIATADAAAYNRQAHLSMEEAVLQTARGIKAGNSELTDSAGITTNLSVMQERYAKQLGTTASKLTEAGKVQAAYNGMMAEAGMFAGNADEAMAGYTGAQATFNKTIKEARQELGAAFIPVLQNLMDMIAPIIKSTAEWASENKDVVAGIGSAALAFTSFIAVVGALSAAFAVLNTAMGGIGVALTLVGAVAAGITAYGVAADKASGAVLRLAQSQEQLNEKLRDSASWTAGDLQNARKDIEELEKILAERLRIQTRIDDLKSKRRNLNDDREIRRVQHELDQIDKALRKMDFETPEMAAKALERLREASKGAVGALLQEQDASFRAAAANNERLKGLEAALATYERLSGLQSLDVVQKQELTSATQTLTSAYPNLNAVMDEEGNLRIKNIDLAGEQIKAERSMLDATLAYEDQRLESLQRITEGQKKSVEAQIENYEKLLETMVDVISADNAGSSPASLQAENLYIRNMNKVPELYSKQNEIQQNLNDIRSRRASLKGGNIPGSGGSGTALYEPGKTKTPKTPKAKKGKSAEELAAEARKKAYDADIATIRYQADMFDWAADKQAEAYEKLRKTHERHLKDVIEDRRTLDLQIKRLGEDTVRSQFAFSAEWIKQEERRMEEAGKTEQEIAQMKIDAWARVRSRHAKDTELYKQADEQLYQARKALTDKTLKLTESLVKVEKARISDAMKAEIEAIKARKKAYVDAQDEKIKAIDALIAKEAEFNSDIDYETELAEKRARADLLASAVGPEGIAEREEILKEIERMQLEHDRELRKRELEEQKKTLQEEKTAQERAYDAEIDGAEKQFAALISAFDSYSGDIKTIEAALAEFRVTEAGKANSAILTELDTFVAQYNAKLAAIKPVQSDLDLAEYNANKDAWLAAKSRKDQAEMARLAARNQELRDKYGIAKDTGYLQSFAVGGIVRGQSGEPVIIQAHAGEMVLNARQQSALFEALNGVAPRPVSPPTGPVTHITNHIDMGVDEVIIEDATDARTLYDERARVAERLQALGVKSI